MYDIGSSSDGSGSKARMFPEIDPGFQGFSASEGATSGLTLPYPISETYCAMALHEIVYVSLACEEMPEAELTKLLAKARLKNQARQISGLMIYHEREFLQLIEGEKEDVTALFDKISTDPRHQQVYLLWENPIKARNFGQWTMGFVLPEGLPPEKREGYAPLFDLGLLASAHDTTGKKLLMMLRDELVRSSATLGRLSDNTATLPKK
jgi:hypothetical protein